MSKHSPQATLVIGCLVLSPWGTAEACSGIYADDLFQRGAQKFYDEEKRSKFQIAELEPESVLRRFYASLEGYISIYNFRLIPLVYKIKQKEISQCFPILIDVMKESQKRRDAVILENEEAIRKNKERQEKSQLPEFILGKAYTQYIFIRKCYQTRQGYLAIYISEAELEKARDTVRSLEKHIKEHNSAIATDDIWTAANKVAETQQFYDRNVCQATLNTLYRSGKINNNSSTDLEKDF